MSHLKAGMMDDVTQSHINEENLSNWPATETVIDVESLKGHQGTFKGKTKVN